MRDEYATNYPSLKVTIRDGSIYPLVHRLAYYAANFASITPFNTAVTLGFYDTPNDTVFVPSLLDTIITR